MKKIIGLYGRANSGKTTTLKILIKLLEGAVQEDNPVLIDKYGEKRIVITPGGDDKDMIEKNLDAFGKLRHTFSLLQQGPKDKQRTTYLTIPE